MKLKCKILDYAFIDLSNILSETHVTELLYADDTLFHRITYFWS